MSESLVVFGCGGHGKVVADAAIAAGWNVLGFADDDEARAGAEILSLRVIAIGLEQASAHCLDNDAHAVVGLGSNEIRKRVYEDLVGRGVRMATIVHPSAVISPSATLGPGTVVFGGVVVNPATAIGANVILNTACSIDHDNALGDHVHVSPGAHTGGTVTVGAGSHIGIGATVSNNIAVGAWSMVGAGAVVVRDLPDRVIAYGCPARVRRPAT
jgi:sugar O-acyltransferase (sialic acid O-acetyltransferase NeuD family)